MQIDKLIWQKHVFRVLLKSKLWVGKVEISRFALHLLWRKSPLNARTISVPFSSDGCVAKAVFSQILMKNRKFCVRNLACTIFFLPSPRSKLLDLWFIYWVLLVEKSTSFFCFFYAEWHFVLPTLFLRFPAPVLFQKNRSGISKRLDLFLTRRREIWKRSNVFWRGVAVFFRGF